MLEVVSACSLSVGSILWQPRPGAWVLTVVCKATHVLMPGESPLARDQDPPNETDDHWNDDERRSLHAASDLVPFKRRADVFLVGHAYAPGMQAVSSLVARLLVGELDKSIEVHADRAWTQQGQLREGARFMKMPLRYERAAGGPESWNPVGMSAGARPDMYGQVPVPNLQPLEFYVARPGEVIPAVGFGPIAPAWPTRASQLHRHAAGWDHARWFERPLPEDVDAGFFNAAPTDQQVGELRSNERIVLENLHAEHARLVTSLCGIVPRAVVEREGAAGAEELRLRCDTLCIDTDRGVCNLVWRGQAALRRADEVGRVVVTAEGAGREEAVQTIVGGLRARDVLPFLETREATAAVQVAEADKTLQLTGLAGAAGPALPFREGESPWGAGPAIETPRDKVLPRTANDGTGTIIAGARVMDQVLPFAQVGTAPALFPEQSLLQAPALSPASAVSARRVEPEIMAPVEALAPPSMIGPLATAELVARTQEPEQPIELAATSPLATSLLPEIIPLPLDAFPIERCAAIAASMARRRTEAARILDENRVTPATWEALDRYWSGAILDETRRGKSALLRAYDASYVRQLESERGPIQAEEYARLAVANERGTVDEVLTELTLPRGAAMRLERVWLERVSDDPKLEERVGAAIEAAREGCG